ncbi:MAG: glycoside hydrolase family 95 protein [Treponema sp.]|nr:glycoside hydrolase family 95 protein [Treponema sp.]
MTKLIFNTPAAQWEEALPLGNGRLGAMIYGSPDRERIQLNEDSIWSGGFRDRNNPAAKESLAEVRRLLNEGRADEAEEICLESFSGIPPAQRVYQTAGELLISFSPAGGFGHPWSGTRGGALLKDVSNYERSLDISRALHTLSFEYDNTVFKRECFISAAAGLLVLRFTAENKDGKPSPPFQRGKISFRASLDRGVFYDRKGNIDDAAFLCRDENIPFCAMMKVIQKGGSQRSRGGFITVANADEALLFLDIQTGWIGEELSRKRGDAEDAEGRVREVYKIQEVCLEKINRQIGRGWDELLQEHVGEYRSWYDRVELKIDGADDTVKYFNFCRYLLISCSRPGTHPANLQGLWNPHMDPPWGCDYTININTQMNYWAACMCNLAETEEPLFDLLERMYPNGKQTAHSMYGCRGFTAHHNTDIWGDTAPRDYWIPASYWVLGAAWLSLHIWEHYEYTLDKDFLKKYFYLLKDACLFFVDFLSPGKDSFLVVSPSVSPENSYRLNETDCASLCAGCEMDNQILRKLFSVVICVLEEFSRRRGGAEDAEEEGEKGRGKRGEEVADLKNLLGRIAEARVHGNGGICEWNEEFEEAEPGHRHFSHLWGLFPGDAISCETPELAAAARKSIEHRLAADGGHTGWSRAWLINFFARLGDGEAALENLNLLFKDFTLPNLFNNGPPFQIDGNFGALAGITQMLVQSRLRDGLQAELKLLPALPQEWQSGSLKGIRIKGNLELDIEWRGGKITSYNVRNKGTEEVSVIVI